MLKHDLTLEIMKQIDRCLQEKMKRMIVLMKDKLGGQIMKKFVGLHPETYNYLKDNNDKGKKTKICVIKRKLKLNDYKT